MDNAARTRAPAAPTLEQARALAEDEYGWRLIDGRPALLSRGGDGGMHWRGSAATAEEAGAWVRRHREEFAQRAAAGDLTHVVFWDPLRERWQVG